MVDNFAEIAPAAGNGAGSNAGIDAYTYGNGNVTVTDETGANVSGYVYGIIASTHEGLTGDVSVIVEENVTISSVTSYGIFAEDSDTVEGNVRVTMNSAGGEMIASGGSGILALNDAATTSHTSEVDVLAHGTILSGAALNGDGSPAAGILAGYDYNGTVDPDAHGSVTIDDYASITAAAGTDGIRGFNYGTGDIAITVEAGAVIDGPRFGVGAFGHDGGDITVTNDGSVTGGTDAIDAASTGDGTATIHNYGHLTGNVAAYNATFVNELHGDWSIDGSSDFTGASTLANCGTIESNGTSVVSGLSCIANSGSIEVETGSLDLSAPVSGTGTLTIDAGSTLELASEVSSGQTVTFSATTGTLKLDQAQNFHGTVSGLGTQDGTQAHSDQIDLVNINHDSADFSEQYDALTDTLTVSDGTNTADIHLTGSYTDANFYFVDDGNPVGGVNGTSGTIVYDPPVLSSPPAQAANGANLGIGASAANDVFVFAPSSSGPAAQHTITDFVAGLDKIDVSQFSTILAFANLNETQHGADTLLTIDSHDTLLLKNVTAASLHASDFIFHA
jgi:hypothetical protein